MLNENTVQRTWSDLKRAPAFFFLIELPNLIPEIFKSKIQAKEISLSWEHFWPILTYFLSSQVIGVVVTGFTFLAVRRLAQSRPIEFNAIWEELKPKMKSLVLATLLGSVVMILGLQAYVIPALIFNALYLYVPFYILSEDKKFLGYFQASWNLAKKNALSSFGIIFVLFLLSFFSEFWLQDALSQGLSPALGKIVYCGLLLVSETVFTLWLSHFFIKISGKQEL